MDRIINMERRNKTNEDIISTELVYMIKRVKCRVSNVRCLIVNLRRNLQDRKRLRLISARFI